MNNAGECFRTAKISDTEATCNAGSSYSGTGSGSNGGGWLQQGAPRSFRSIPEHKLNFPIDSDIRPRKP